VIERHDAQLIGLPFERLARYPGSASGWQNATLNRRRRSSRIDIMR